MIRVYCLKLNPDDPSIAPAITIALAATYLYLLGCLPTYRCWDKVWSIRPHQRVVNTGHARADCRTIEQPADNDWLRGQTVIQINVWWEMWLEVVCLCKLYNGSALYPVYTIEQTLSKRRANVIKIHVLIARRLLDVCSMFASINPASSTNYGN